MKRLTTYISHMKDLHSLNEYVQEKLVINKNYKQYTYTPKSWNELKKIIKDRYDKLGAGTKQNPIDFNDIDVSNIDSFYDGNIGGIFEKTEFKYIDISDWDVSNVKDMCSIFYRCKKLESIGNLSNWDVSNVNDMRYMFFECEQLKSVGDLSNWDVSNVNDIHKMFFKCEKLESVGNLSNWNISSVNDASWMFTRCHNLKSVGDLSNWDVSNVEDMLLMFKDSGITNIPSWYK